MVQKKRSVGSVHKNHIMKLKLLVSFIIKKPFSLPKKHIPTNEQEKKTINSFFMHTHIHLDITLLCVLFHYYVENLILAMFCLFFN